ncbi:MAG: hypothetical protein EG828_06255 [Deltaproteobacteria bacterium]|nr:hypothetical protein [Deltaproteobacteria bacterium]
MEKFLQAIGAIVVAGGGISVMVYGAFRVLAQKWLDAKFSERLESYKHEQQKQIEQLRFKINALLDRATKFHQREYDVLPEAWALLNDAFWKASGFVAPLKQYPDLSKMTATHLKEFLEASTLSGWEREEALAAFDRTDYYIKRIFWHSLNDVQTTAREAHICILKKGIFFQPDLRKKFKDIDDVIWNALSEAENNERFKVYPLDFTKRDILLNEGPKLLEELELLVQGRLWNTDGML